MHLLHLTDFHYGDPATAPLDPAAPALSKSLPIADRLERCQKSLAGISLDALILSGDFSMDGNPADARQLMQEIDLFFPDLPVAFVPGNHDHLAKPAKNASSAKEYVPSDKVFLLPDLSVICLDTSRPGNDRGVIDPAQCQWLKQQLTKPDRQPTILVTHFHLLPGQHAMPCAAYPDEFMEIVAQSSLIAVFTGHTHCHYQGFFGGKPYCTAPGFSFYGLPAADGTVFLEPCFGYNLYTIEKGYLANIKTETFYVSLDTL